MLFIPGFNVRQPSRKRTICDVWCSDPFLQRMELDTSHGEKSESYSGSYNPIRQIEPTLEDGHD